MQTVNFILRLGKVFLQSQQNQLAKDAFLQAQSIDLRTKEALDLYAQIALSNVKYMEEHYYELLYTIANYRYAPPDLLKSNISKVVEQLGPVYNKVKIARKQKNNAFSIDTEKILSNDIKRKELEEKKIKTMRYHPRFEKYFNGIVSQHPELNKLYEEIEKQKRIEMRSYFVFLLHKFYLEPSFSLPDGFHEKIREILRDNGEEIFTRYLAARAIFHTLGFEQIIDFVSGGTVEEKLICLGVLREQGIVVPQKKSFWSKAIEKYPHLFAQSYFLPQEESFDFLLGVRQEIEVLLQGKNIRTALQIANICFAHPKLTAIAQNTYQKFMRHENQEICQNAYYYYGYNMSKLIKSYLDAGNIEKVESSLNQYYKMLEEVIATESNEVIFSVLNRNLEYLRLPDISGLSNKLKNSNDIMLHIHILNFLVQQRKFQYVVEYYSNTNSISILRIFYLQNHMSFFVAEPIIPARQKPEKKHLIKPKVEKLIQSHEPLLKSYGYSMNGALKGDICRYISKESDLDVKATMFMSLTLGEGAMDDPMFKFFITSIWPNRDSLKTKFSVTKKYLNHPHDNLRRSANFAHTYFASPSQRRKIVKETVSKKDFLQKEGIVGALFLRFRDKIIQKGRKTYIDYIAGNASGNKWKGASIRVFRKAIKDKKERKNFKKELQQIVRISQQTPEHLFYLALIYQAEKNTKKAISLLEKIISIDSNFIFAHIELASISTKKTDLLNQIHAYVEHRHIHPICLKPLIEIQHEKVGAILKQNYLRIVRDRNKRFRNEKKQEAWDSIVSFYEKYEPRFVDRFKRCELIELK